LKTKDLEVEQQTNYPWDGKITLTIKKAKNLTNVKLHKPDWATEYTVKVNGEPADLDISRKWKKGDVIEVNFDMRPRLIEANPLVEEAKNQIAVQRGPIVYCLEGEDIEGGYRINDIAIPADIQFTEQKMTISGHEMTVLEGEAVLVNQEKWDNQTLYREIRPTNKKKVKIRLIPYYAWDNRGIQDMSLWLPLAR
jgi:DUF1680 family protein